MVISSDRGKISYSDKGEGQVIVLIHGYLETRKVWDDLSERLAGVCRVITIDLPGHGESDPRGPVNTMELFADSVKELIEKLQIKKVFLAGHSMGGYTVLAFLQLYPGYLSGYALIHSHPFNDKPAAIEKRKVNIELVRSGRKNEMIPGFVANLYSSFNQDKFKREIERSVSIASGINEDTIIADLRGMMERPSREKLIENGSLPFLWILGRNDSHINPDEMLQAVSLPSGSAAVILEKSGHMGFIEEPDKTAEVLRDFIANLT